MIKIMIKVWIFGILVVSSLAYSDENFQNVYIPEGKISVSRRSMDQYGRVFVFSLLRDRSVRPAQYDTFLLNLADGKVKNISLHKKYPNFKPVGAPFITADGETILTTGYLGEAYSVYQYPISGSSKPVAVAKDIQGKVISGSLSDISLDGKKIVFNAEGYVVERERYSYSLDWNISQVYMRDLDSGQVTMLSALQNGNAPFMTQIPYRISADGQYTAFANWADLMGGRNSIHAHAYMRRTDLSKIWSPDGDGSAPLVISGTGLVTLSDFGKYMLSDGPMDLEGNYPAAGSYGLILWDIQSKTGKVINTNADGELGNGKDWNIWSKAGRQAGVIYFSRDERYVVFPSISNNLVKGIQPANDNHPVIYAKNLKTGKVTPLSTGRYGRPLDAYPVFQSALTSDGQTAVIIQENTSEIIIRRNLKL